MGWKRTAYAVLATTALFALPAWSAPVWADGAAVARQNAQQGVVQRPPEAPAGQLQRAQILNILHSDVIPALSHYGLGDFLKTLTVEQAYYMPQEGMYPGHPLWNVFLSAPVSTVNGQPTSPQAHFNASFDAKTGELLDFNLQNPAWTCTEGPSQEVASSQAKKFLQSFEPALYQKTQLSNDRYGSGSITTTDKNGKPVQFYSSMVNFYEVVNGLPFKSNMVSVSIDQFGHVVGMRKLFPVDSSQLPPATGAMSMNQANQIYANDLQMHKYYVTGQLTRNPDGTMTWTANPMLVYLPEYPGAFDAVTGKTQMDFPGMTELANPIDLQVSGTGDKWNINDLDTVKQMVGDLTQVDLSKLTYNDQSKNSGLTNPDVSTISWGQPVGQYGYQPEIVSNYDKSTGEILSIQHFAASQPDSNAGQDAQPTFSLQQGEAKAEKILSSLLPSGQQDVLLTQEFDTKSLNTPPSWFDPAKTDVMRGSQPNSYTYEFHLSHQGVPILDQTISIDLDPVTGALRSFGRSVPHQVAWPDNANALPADQVKQVFIKDHPLQLYYSWPQYMMEYAPNGLLLYGITSNALDQPFSYDAITGQPVALTK